MLSVVDTLGGALNLPDWFPSVALALLIVGLPIVLATAFVQEGGPGRDANATPTADGPTGAPALFTWRNAFGGGVLAFALLGFVGTGWILFGGGLGGGSDTGELPQQATIAVLPFRNDSPDVENAFFADGVHEDIITQLSKISGLAVRPRASVMGYPDAPERNLMQISEELATTAILVGSVRRVDNQIRVTTQLIDASTDENLWGETYDRQLEDVFAVQGEIAQRVAEALQATLTPREAALIASVPTVSLEAYDLYVKGRAAYLKRTSSDNDEAVRLYLLALQLDPEYARAWAGLASAYALRPFSFGGDPMWGDSALVITERALALDPDLSEAHNAVGLIYGSRGWRQRAYQEYLRAWELDPNANSVMNNIGASLRAQGQLDEALAWYERALRVDPSSTLYRSGIAFIYAAIGDTARAVRFERDMLAQQDSDGAQALATLAGIDVLENRDHEQALEIFEGLVERDPASVEYRFEAAEASFILGDFECVIGHIEEARRLAPDSILDDAAAPPRVPRGMLLYGLALLQRGREDEGRDFLMEVVERRRSVIAQGNEDAPPWLDLTVAHGALGEASEALAAFEQAYQIGGAYVAGLLGPREGYWEALELTSLPSQSRFQAVMRQIEGAVTEMRRRILARQTRS